LELDVFDEIQRLNSGRKRRWQRSSGSLRRVELQNLQIADTGRWIAVGLHRQRAIEADVWVTAGP
jgi:hypothetical protein